MESTELGLRRRGSQARGRVTREKLLDSAELLFTRNGYDGTSMGDVARRAGCGVGTLYHHFADKRALLFELIERFGDRMASHRRTDIDFAAFLGDDPRRAIATFLERVFDRLRKRPSLYLDMAMVQLLLREQTGPAPERVLAELTELFSRYVQKEPP